MKSFRPWTPSFLLAAGALIFIAAARPAPGLLSAFSEVWHGATSDIDEPARASLDPGRPNANQAQQLNSQDSSVQPETSQACGLRKRPNTSKDDVYYQVHTYAYGRKEDSVGVKWQKEFGNWLSKMKKMYKKLQQSHRPLSAPLDLPHGSLLYHTMQGPKGQLVAIELHIEAGVRFQTFINGLSDTGVYRNTDEHQDCWSRLSEVHQEGVRYMGQPYFSLYAFKGHHRSQHEVPVFWIKISALPVVDCSAIPEPSYGDPANVETEDWSLATEQDKPCALNPRSLH